MGFLESLPRGGSKKSSFAIILKKVLTILNASAPEFITDSWFCQLSPFPEPPPLSSFGGLY